MTKIGKNNMTKEETIRELEVLVDGWDDCLKVLRIVVQTHYRLSKHWRMDWDGFTYIDCVGCKPVELTKLFRAGILECVSPQGKRIVYRVVDIETVNTFIEDFKKNRIKNEATDESMVRIDPPLLNSLFDDIIGYDDLKDLIVRVLKKERPTHFIFIGPPSSAKSMFLDDIAKLPNSVFAVATTSSKVGILDILFDDRPNYLVIDEIDKASGRDLAVLNTLMQRGVVCENKHKKTRRMKLNTFVFMAANNESKIYQDLLSRAFVFRFKEYDNETFIKTVVGVLDKEGVNRDIAELVAKECLENLRTRDVREALRIARLIDTTEEIGKIIEVIKRYRRRRR